MKVLFLNPSNAPYRDGFYKELSKLISVKFLHYFKDAYGAEGTDYEILKGEYNMIGYGRGFNPTLIHRLFKEDYDVVVNSDPCSFAAHISFIIAKIRGKKFVTWAELWQYPNTKAAQLIKPYVKSIVKGSDLCIAAGSRAEKLLKDFGAKKIVIAPNSSFDVTQLKRYKIKYYNYILQVGEIRECEGILELIKSFKRLNPDCSLIFIGKANDKEYFKKCKEEAQGYNIAFLGYIKWTMLRPFYENCLFCIHAAIPVGGIDPVHSWEMSLNEAMSASKPIIATDVIAGAYDLIEEGKNGYMVKPDVYSIYQAMQKLLKAKNLNSMGVYSRMLYEKTFNQKNMAKIFAEAIKCLKIK